MGHETVEAGRGKAAIKDRVREDCERANAAKRQSCANRLRESKAAINHRARKDSEKANAATSNGM